MEERELLLTYLLLYRPGEREREREREMRETERDLGEN